MASPVRDRWAPSIGILPRLAWAAGGTAVSLCLVGLAMYRGGTAGDWVHASWLALLGCAWPAWFLVRRRSAPSRQRRAARRRPLASQVLRRVAARGGGEAIAATVRTRTRVGERQYTFHLSFCPPLAGKVRGTAVLAPGFVGTVTIAELRSYGVRLEVRLREVPDEPVVLAVFFRATSHPESVPVTSR